eukprot:gene69285-biopygen11109
MDDATLDYVRSSSFTNSISNFPGRIKENQQLIPESALCLLASTEALISKDCAIEIEIQKEFKKIWGNLLNHIISGLSPPLGQPLEDVFARVLRMRILSTHLQEHSPGQTTIQDLFAIDMSAIKYTIGGTPYNAAKISDTGKTVTQDGVAKKDLKQWEKDTFEMVTSITTSSQTKIGPDEIVLVFEEKSIAENSSGTKVWKGH